MKWLARLTGRALRPDAPPANAGEPLLRCFGCERLGTLDDLMLYPWWDASSEQFESMYRCSRCAAGAQKALSRDLRRNAAMLACFAGYVAQNVAPKTDEDTTAASTADALQRALDTLEALRTRKALVLLRRL